MLKENGFSDSLLDDHLIDEKRKKSQSRLAGWFNRVSGTCKRFFNDVVLNLASAATVTVGFEVGVDFVLYQERYVEGAVMVGVASTILAYKVAQFQRNEPRMHEKYMNGEFEGAEKYGFKKPDKGNPKAPTLD